MNGHSELKLDALRNIQPMELGRMDFISAEWICAKFTWKTYLVPRLDEFECQGLSTMEMVQVTLLRRTLASSPLLPNLNAQVAVSKGMRAVKLCSNASCPVYWP